ncbi:hypothetical protein N7522_005806 [Penicillium canescens]|nr:hypothetical protein N7522_005806 [Penicillium canescens]KAJ6029086.1 hypothetical protein N7444_012073 [Penicillium canescens]KAJ6173060.1 hypothetical protein N7485_005872 [Penicillium canescens]
MQTRKSLIPHRRDVNRTLRFTEDGTFQISVFSDLHFAEDDGSDNKSRKVIETVLSSEDAQLVVLNGDLISGEAIQNANSSSIYVDRIVAPIIDNDLPWASTYGNHDSEINLDPEDIFLREKIYPNSLTQKRVSNSTAGITNYYLPVFAHGASNDATPEFILWFFDSQGGHYPIDKNYNGTSVPRQNWVDDSVLHWFKNAKANLTSTYGGPIPSIAFVHIPVYPMRAFQLAGVSPSKEPGINGERVQQQGYGNDNINYDSQDSPFIQALLNTTGLVATFSGHDHDNDWCFKWNGTLSGLNVTGNGINMCYGRHTGYGGYGDWARGGRQILLDRQLLGDDLRTWVRLEDGSISGNVHLNNTYGHDRYRLVEKRMTGQGDVLSSQLSSIFYIWVFFFSLFIAHR